MSDTKRRRLESGSKAFTYIFTVETCAKLLAYGFAGFCADGMNLFDAAVVLLSLVDLFASVSDLCLSSLLAAMRALQT